MSGLLIWLPAAPGSALTGRSEKVADVAHTDVLWGGTLISLSIDPTHWTASFLVEVHEGEPKQPTNWRLKNWRTCA